VHVRNNAISARSFCFVIEAAPLVGTLTEGKDFAIDVYSPERIATARDDL